MNKDDPCPFTQAHYIEVACNADSEGNDAFDYAPTASGKIIPFCCFGNEHIIVSTFNEMAPWFMV